MSEEKRPSHEVSFNTIRKLTAEAIATARKAHQKGKLESAVNWADLRVVAVEFYENDANEFGYRVAIAEASPTAHEFIEFISATLVKQGLKGVEIVTEW